MPSTLKIAHSLFLRALGIVAKILFVRHEQKDCSVKPDPKGNAQIKNKPFFRIKKGMLQPVAPPS